MDVRLLYRIRNGGFMSENIINHYEICCFLYAGDILQAQKSFAEKVKEQESVPSAWNISLSSLNYAIYNFILLQENISLHECCFENIHRISHAAGNTFLQTGNEIIEAYGMDCRYLIAKYKNPQIRQAIGYIHNHLHEELTLQKVSDVLYLNKTYFCQTAQRSCALVVPVSGLLKSCILCLHLLP